MTTPLQWLRRALDPTQQQLRKLCEDESAVGVEALQVFFAERIPGLVDELLKKTDLPPDGPRRAGGGAAAVRGGLPWQAGQRPPRETSHLPRRSSCRA